MSIESYVNGHFSTMNLTTLRFSRQRLRSICDISLVCKLGSSQSVIVRSSCNGTVSGCKYCKHDLADHTIDPDSLLHDDVLCFDHHASGQKYIVVSHLHIVSMVTAFHQLNTKMLQTEMDNFHFFSLFCSLFSPFFLVLLRIATCSGSPRTAERALPYVH